MDFDFTGEQTMLRSLTREFLARESGPRAVRALFDDPLGYQPATWQQAAEMGLPGVVVDPGAGGQGLGMIELALVLEEMGRAAYPSPYFATSVLAATVLGGATESAAAERWLPEIAAGTSIATLALVDDALDWSSAGIQTRATRQGDRWVLHGQKRFVPDALAAQVLLVVARTSAGPDGTTVFAVPADARGLGCVPNVEMDRTSRTATVTLDGVEVDAAAVVGPVDGGWSLVGPTLQRAAVGAAAMMLGAARQCLEMSVEYARVRHQFGQPIGMFQAIKHACADMLLEVENAHAATYYAAWAQDAGTPDAALAAAVAKSYVGDAARKVCGASIQVHGGIGFTWEYDLHLYVKRAKHYEPLYGSGDWHRERALELVLAQTQSVSQTVGP
jgi:alkylation response protein AidB-like acyl-CoA dehydrogenase